MPHALRVGVMPVVAYDGYKQPSRFPVHGASKIDVNTSFSTDDGAMATSNSGRGSPSVGLAMGCIVALGLWAMQCHAHRATDSVLSASH